MFSCPRIEFFLPMDRVLPLDCRLGSASLRIAWANPMVLHSFWLELKLDSSKPEPAIASFLTSGHTAILGNNAKFVLAEDCQQRSRHHFFTACFARRKQ